MLKRRNFICNGLLLSSGLFLGDGFSIRPENFSNADKDIKERIRQFGRREKIDVLTRAEELHTFAVDFGKIYTSTPQAVLQPKTGEEVQKIMRFLAKENIPVAIRAKGHSQSGQSLPVDGGVSLDMTKMKSIYHLDEDRMSCAALSNLLLVI